MSGKIVYEPPIPCHCDRPDPADYKAGTMWACDDCGKWWEVVTAGSSPYWRVTLPLPGPITPPPTWWQRFRKAVGR